MMATVATLTWNRNPPLSATLDDNGVWQCQASPDLARMLNVAFRMEALPPGYYPNPLAECARLAAEKTHALVEIHWDEHQEDEVY